LRSGDWTLVQCDAMRRGHAELGRSSTGSCGDDTIEERATTSCSLPTAGLQLACGKAKVEGRGPA
jgi:hypothetical protein